MNGNAPVPVDGLPEALISPPWARAAGKPVVIKGLAPPAGAEVAWAVGEREALLAHVRVDSRFTGPEVDWAGLVARYKAGGLPHFDNHLLIYGPVDLVRPLLADWGGYSAVDAERWLGPVVARFGVDALPALLRSAKSGPVFCGGLLMPFLSAEVARMMADWLARLRSANAIAASWFERHGTSAVRQLVPAAVGKPGKERRNAEGALLLLASRLGTDGVVEVAREYGDAAARAIEARLTDGSPVQPPKIGEWADPAGLPQVMLKGGGAALPGAAAGHLVTMLAMSRPGEPDPGVRAAREVCDPGSLAEFGWAIFRRWQAAGAPVKDDWALTQLAWTGDDETVRRLTPVIRSWPREGGHARAAAGLDVLAAIGGDVALIHMYGISQKVASAALQARAKEKIAGVAALLGLTPAELGERLVPDFGLDAGGGLVLDYGPRRFVVGFDELLRPRVTGEDGRLLKALPKPGAKDDPVLAPDAHRRFAGLKKDVRTVAAQQIRRLESAMVERRRWTAAEFQVLFAAHPLLWHLTKRVVWLAEDGGRTTAFRLAEDRTLADVDDGAPALPESARVGVAHPVDLGDALGDWAGVFADYEILQPFPQLGRAVHRLTERERASARLERFEGARVPVGKILGLERRGWRRGHPDDGAVQDRIIRELPAGRHVAVVELSPGLPLGRADLFPEQELVQVEIEAALDPVTASEVITDLTELVGKAP